MFGNKKYLAVIPARGGSTRLPNKNIKIFCGKPLVAWSIEAAKTSKLLDRIIISTDNEKIKKIAQQYNVEVHHRSEKLADEFSLIVETLYDIIQEYPGYHLVVLNPTSPIRAKGLIDKCIAEFDKNDYEALATGLIVKYVPWPSSMKRSQDLRGFFIDNGDLGF